MTTITPTRPKLAAVCLRYHSAGWLLLVLLLAGIGFGTLFAVAAAIGATA